MDSLSRTPRPPEEPSLSFSTDSSSSSVSPQTVQEERAVVRSLLDETLDFVPPDSKAAKPPSLRFTPDGPVFRVWLNFPSGSRQMAPEAQELMEAMIKEAAESNLSPDEKKQIHSFSISLTKKKVVFYLKGGKPLPMIEVPFKNEGDVRHFEHLSTAAHLVKHRGSARDATDALSMIDKGGQGQRGAEPFHWSNHKLPAWDSTQPRERAIPESWWRPILALVVAHKGGIDALEITAEEDPDPLQALQQGLVTREKKMHEQLHRSRMEKLDEEERKKK